MDSLPVMAGLITASGTILLLLSLLAYRRTGMNRMLAMSAVSGILLLKGILFLLGLREVVDMSYEMMAATDLILLLVLAMAIFGNE